MNKYQQIISIDKQVAIASEAISALEESVSNALKQIHSFANHPDFASKMELMVKYKIFCPQSDY